MQLFKCIKIDKKRKKKTFTITQQKLFIYVKVNEKKTHNLEMIDKNQFNLV